MDLSKIAIMASLAAISATTASAAECSDVLIPRVASFQSSISKWLALLNVVNMGQQQQANSSVGLGYAGYNLSYNDAQAAASFYQQRTRYSLAQSETLSIATTELPPELARSFVDCVKATKQDITITAPSGADRLKAFQIKVLWTPTYNVSVIDGKTERPVTISITNGKEVQAKRISPTNSVTFNIFREDLDEPISIAASIDGRDSDFFTFPARPQYDLSLKSVRESKGPMRRSGHYGNTEASIPFCLTPPDGDSQYIPGTVNATVTGNGYEWQPRSRIEVTEKTPLSVCAVVHTAGVPCNEDKCYHDTTGHLSAVQSTIVKINYR